MANKNAIIFCVVTREIALLRELPAVRGVIDNAHAGGTVMELRALDEV